VHRIADINLEARQRCKVLTHPTQVNIRKERMELIQNEIHCKSNEKIELSRKKIEKNKEVEKDFVR